MLPRLFLFLGLLFFIAPITLLYLVIANYSDKSLKFAIILATISVIAFLLMVVLPLRFWGKRITKWQLWAFDHCQDLAELRRQAKFAALYFEENTLLNRLLQPASKAARKQLAALRQNFNKPALFADDPAVPPVSAIKLSLTNLLIGFIFNMIGISLGGIVLLYAPADTGIWGRTLGGLLVACMLYVLLTGAWNYFIKPPRLILSNKGVETAQSGSISWDKIRNERVEERSLGRGASALFFCYDYPGGTVDMRISAFAIGRAELSYLLYIYRNRFQG